MFKAAIHWLGLVEEWCEFRDQAYERIEMEWCEEHGIPFVDE